MDMTPRMCGHWSEVNTYVKLLILGLFTLSCGVDANNCTTTEIHGHDVTTRLQQLKATPVLDYPTNIDDTSLRLDVSICPNNGSLKIELNTNTTQALDVRLCYQMKAVLNGRHLHTSCYLVQLIRSSHPLIMSCWFPMTHFNDRPIINAWAVSSSTTGSRLYVGHLNTALLDPVRPCENVCEVSLLMIPNIVTCNHVSSIRHENDVRVKRVTFIQDNGTRNELDFSRKLDDQLQYYLNCSHGGEANIQVLYMIRGQYCLKYQHVHVLCTDCERKLRSVGLRDDGQPFGTFVTYGVICFATTTAIVVLIIAVVQNKDRIVFLCHGSHRDTNPETFPMNPNNRHHRVTFDVVPRSRTSSTSEPMRHNNHKPRKASIASRLSANSNSATNEVLGSKLSLVKTTMLQRSATMALLEVTDPVYRKKILFLPSIWDHFSRDVSNLLKQLFTTGAKVTAQCCYDRDVYQAYMTGDKYRWIENILGDRDRIVVFLCFTNLDNGAQCGDEVDMFSDVLSHLLRTGNMSHLLCKVIYLHLTDSEEGSQLERNHHGDSYRINNCESFGVFLRDTMINCGLKIDEADPLSRQLLTSTPSEDFLTFIGIVDHPQWYGEEVNKRHSTGSQTTSVRL